MGDFGGPNFEDEAIYVLNFVTLTGLALTEAMLSAPSGAELYRGIALTTIAVPNTVPPDPFLRVSGRWSTFAQSLATERTTLEGILERVGGDTDENLWTGDGADAFRGYVDDQMLKGINDLATASSTMSEMTQGFTEGVTGIAFAQIKGYAFVTALIIYQIAIQPTKAIPFVGMGVFAGLTWGSVAVEALLWADLLIFLMLDLQGYSGAQEEINGIIEGLEQTFGSEGSRLEGEAEAVRNRDPGTIIGDPTEWSKDDD